MSLQTPKIRDDLVVSHRQTESDTQSCHIIKIPETGRFYRFGEIEYFIIEQLDGKTSLKAVCDRVAATYRSTLSLETLSGFIANLAHRGILKQEASFQSTSSSAKRIRGNWLHLRCNFFDPDLLLTRLAQKLRFLFTPTFVFASSAMMLLAGALFIGHYDEIQRDLVQHLAMENLWAVGAVLAVTALLHEFAHGLSCKHFGGQVREIGFLLIYFMPAFFCNISDAWLFPQKSRRLWVAFAGAYCELWLWATAVFCWRLFAEDTVVHYLALIVIGSSGIRILLNFNPLIKLDGYYMLSDYLDVPNLRAKALTYIGFRLKTIGASQGKQAEITPREKIIYLTYGLLAAGFSAFILGYLAFLLAGFLIDLWQGTGFIIFIGIITVMFHHKLRQLTSSILSIFVDPQKIRLSAQKRWLKITVPLLLIASLSLLQVDLMIAGEFEIKPLHNADIRAEIEAIIDRIYVREGDMVRKGDRLVHLSEREYRLQLHKIEAQIRENRAQLNMLTAGATAEEIASARSRVETAKTRYQHALKTEREAEQIHRRHVNKVESAIAKAQEQLRFAEKKLQRIVALSNKRVIPQITLEQVQEEVATKQNELKEAEAELSMVQADQHADIVKELAIAKNEVKQAEADLGKLLAGSRPEEIESIEAVINALQIQRQYLQSDLRRVSVVSPIDGIVTTEKVQEKIGQWVKKGDLILEVYRFDSAKVEMLIPEKEIGDIHLGQPVILKARAYPDRSFHGTVSAIAPTAMDDDSGLTRKVVRVSTTIANRELLLKPEMTGHAKINCGTRTLFELFTRRLTRYLKVEFWSLW